MTLRFLRSGKDEFLFEIKNLSAFPGPYRVYLWRSWFILNKKTNIVRSKKIVPVCPENLRTLIFLEFYRNWMNEKRNTKCVTCRKKMGNDVKTKMIWLFLWLCLMIIFISIINTILLESKYSYTNISTCMHVIWWKCNILCIIYIITTIIENSFQINIQILLVINIYACIALTQTKVLYRTVIAR